MRSFLFAFSKPLSKWLTSLGQTSIDMLRLPSEEATRPQRIFITGHYLQGYEAYIYKIHVEAGRSTFNHVCAIGPIR